MSSEENNTDGLPLAVPYEQDGQWYVEIDGVEYLYDDSEWTEEEMRASLARLFDDPDVWGAPEMDCYDRLYGEPATDDDNKPA